MKTIAWSQDVTGMRHTVGGRKTAKNLPGHNRAVKPLNLPPSSTRSFFGVSAEWENKNEKQGTI
jgi:hypothetical protein